MTAEKTIELRNNLHRKLKEHEYVIACLNCAIGAARTSKYDAKKSIKNRRRCFKCNRLFEIISATVILEAQNPWEDEVNI